MKNKKRASFLIIAAFFLLAFRYNDETKKITRDSNDDIKKVIEVNINTNPLTMGMSVYTFDIFKDTLYVVNKGNFILINLKTGKISKNLKVSDFLNKKFKSHINATNIKVRDNGYYISCINELYFIDYFGKMNKISDNDGNIITDFNIAEDKIILASRGNKIKLIKKNGSPISTVSLEMADDGHIPSYAGLCYDGGDYIYESNVNRSNQIAVKKYLSISQTKEIKDMSIAFNSDQYFIGFSYYQRNSLYIFSKNSAKNEIVKQINLGQSYFDKTAPMDEGRPNFRVAAREGFNYLVVVSNKKLNVFTFTF